MGNSIIAVVVGLGSADFISRAEKLSKDLKSTGWFSCIELVTDLAPYCKNIDIASFVRSGRTGYGSYFWKPIVVMSVFSKYQIGDVIVYIDAGCEISHGGKEMFFNNIEIARQNGNLFFEINYNHFEWIRSDLKKYFPEDSYLRSIQAGYFYTVINCMNRRIFELWQKLTLYNVGYYLHDSGDLKHRHDQSILNHILFRRKNWFFIKEAEDNFPRRLYYKYSYINLFPIHVLRTRRVNYIDYHTSPDLVKYYEFDKYIKFPFLFELFKQRFIAKYRSLKVVLISFIK